MKKLGAVITFSFGAMLTVACSADPAADDEATGASEAAIHPACVGKKNGDNCGYGGPGNPPTNPKFCYRGRCRQSCGIGMTGYGNGFLCGLNKCISMDGSADDRPTFLAGQGNTVYGLCSDSPTGTWTHDIATCDNGVPHGGCAYDGTSRYKCISPGGSSQSAGSSSNIAYQWIRCPNTTCTCTEPSPPARCDNGVPKGQCATNGTRRYKCVNPGGASAWPALGSQWTQCPASTPLTGCC